MPIALSPFWQLMSDVMQVMLTDTKAKVLRASGQETPKSSLPNFGLPHRYCTCNLSPSSGQVPCQAVSNNLPTGQPPPAPQAVKLKTYELRSCRVAQCVPFSLVGFRTQHGKEQKDMSGSSRRELRIRVPFFLLSMLAGEPSPKKETETGHHWGT